jgi:hypothetical protein
MASRRGAVAPLALAAAAHASAFEARFENDAVDALPYADVLPEGWRDAAEALVREEARARAAGACVRCRAAAFHALRPCTRLHARARAALGGDARAGRSRLRVRLAGSGSMR